MFTKLSQARTASSAVALPVLPVQLRLHPRTVRDELPCLSPESLPAIYSSLYSRTLRDSEKHLDTWGCSESFHPAEDTAGWRDDNATCRGRYGRQLHSRHVSVRAVRGGARAWFGYPPGMRLFEHIPGSPDSSAIGSPTRHRRRQRRRTPEWTHPCPSEGCASHHYRKDRAPEAVSGGKACACSLYCKISLGLWRYRSAISGKPRRMSHRYGGWYPYLASKSSLRCRAPGCISSVGAFACLNFTTFGVGEAA